jgi:SAM-dependent methyltransferase
MENKEIKDDKDFKPNKELELGSDFWNNQYKSHATGWDLGEVSPPIKNYIDQLTDKSIRILIPGCGNTYEADYLISKGFNNITLIDISSTLVEKLQQKYAGNPSLRIILGDFFEHEGEYDLILEQTFFCAISPALREKYAKHMNDLLSESGKIAGVLFNRNFDFQGPPFGGSKGQYQTIFEKYFILKTFDPCYNSFSKRDGTELFINLIKK